MSERTLEVEASMRTQTSSPTGRRIRKRRPAALVVLAVLLALLALASLQGGVAMVLNPRTPLGMSVEQLQGAPVDSYWWPGWFLIGIAAASLVAAAGLMFRWEWEWTRPLERAIGYRWPWLATVATGTVLLVFEVLELFMIPFHPIMHPLLIAWSIGIIALPFLPSVRRSLRVG